MKEVRILRAFDFLNEALQNVMSAQTKLLSVYSPSPALNVKGSHTSRKKKTTSILSLKRKITALKLHLGPCANDERSIQRITKRKIL